MQFALHYSSKRFVQKQQISVHFYSRIYNTTFIQDPKGDEVSKLFLIIK